MAASDEPHLEVFTGALRVRLSQLFHWADPFSALLPLPYVPLLQPRARGHGLHLLTNPVQPLFDQVFRPVGALERLLSVGEKNIGDRNYIAVHFRSVQEVPGVREVNGKLPSTVSPKVVDALMKSLDCALAVSGMLQNISASQPARIVVATDNTMLAGKVLEAGKWGDRAQIIFLDTMEWLPTAAHSLKDNTGTGDLRAYFDILTLGLGRAMVGSYVSSFTWLAATAGGKRLFAGASGKECTRLSAPAPDAFTFEKCYPKWKAKLNCSSGNATLRGH